MRSRSFRGLVVSFVFASVLSSTSVFAFERGRDPQAKYRDPSSFISKVIKRFKSVIVRIVVDDTLSTPKP